MKKLTLLLISVASMMSISAYARTSAAYAKLDHGGDMGRFHQCMKEAWFDAEPTDEQNENAQAVLAQLKAVFDEHMPAVRDALAALAAAWHEHPITQAKVVAAEGSLTTAAGPIKSALRDGVIEVINLLSDEQRAEFDDSFEYCMSDRR